MGGSRSGMHYRKRGGGGSMEPTSRTAHRSRDAAYRAALGLGEDKPIPKELGTVSHQRPEFDTGYLA